MTRPLEESQWNGLAVEVPLSWLIQLQRQARAAEFGSKIVLVTGALAAPFVNYI
jgi:hypothetical protein